MDRDSAAYCQRGGYVRDWVLLLPIGRFVFHEQIGWQVIVGTFVAIAGVAVLFLV